LIEVALRHDLLNQLAIIRGFAEILLGEAAAGDPRRPDFALIHTAARTAIDLLGGGEPDQEAL